MMTYINYDYDKFLFKKKLRDSLRLLNEAKRISKESKDPDVYNKLKSIKDTITTIESILNKEIK